MFKQTAILFALFTFCAQAEIEREGDTDDPFDAANILYLGHLNEAQGATTFYDSSGNARHGTCPIGGASGCSACPTRGQSGSFLPYYTFSGSNQCISMGDQNSMEGIQAFSVSAWIRSSTTGQTTKGLVAKCDDAAGSWCFYVNGTNLIWWMNATATSSASVLQTTAFNGDWRHIVGTYNGANSRFWLDGVSIANPAMTGNINSNTDVFSIGSWTSNNNTCFNGNIAEVIVYNKTLTRDAVQQLYYTTAMRRGFSSQLRTNPFLWSRWVAARSIAP